MPLAISELREKSLQAAACKEKCRKRVPFPPDPVRYLNFQLLVSKLKFPYLFGIFLVALKVNSFKCTLLTPRPYYGQDLRTVPVHITKGTPFPKGLYRLGCLVPA